ncbi:MAG: ribonuclease H-like domain-containing protein [Rickettsiales bacterium]|nr:ribonuclease H-like domain-containing protein [Rickettsiales bacterium]
MSRIVCFDTETTGFDYRNGDKIIEIAAVEILDGKLTGAHVHELINPEGKLIPKEAYEVHKISNHALEGKPKFKEIAPKVLEFFKDSLIVAHNGQDFDFPFFNFQLRASGLPEVPRERQCDSLILARNRVFGPKSYSLDALAKWFDISLKEREFAHSALVDSKILAQVYLELTRAQDMESYDSIKERFEKAMKEIPKTTGREPRDFPPSEAELKTWNEFLEKSVKSPAWTQP